MITMRPEILYLVVKLSQLSSNPEKVHYDAVYGIFQYIFGTRNDGLTYTRKIPTNWGPVLAHVPLRSQPMDRKEEHVPSENLTTLYIYSDSDWVVEIIHRRSICGLVFFLGGSVIGWKTRVLPTVSLSTAESEFLAARQLAAPTIYEDNDACIKVADSSRLRAK
jgi:hypothetical protein